MTEEEKSINNLRKYIDEDVIYKNKKSESDFDEYCINHCKDIETILNLLQRKQKEIEKLRDKNKDLLRKLRNRVKEVKKLAKYSLYKTEFSRLNKEIKLKTVRINEAEYLYNKALNDLVKAEKENKNKDKIIDIMAEFIDKNIDDCLLNILNIDEPCENYIGKNKKLCKYCIKQYFKIKVEGKQC